MRKERWWGENVNITKIVCSPNKRYILLSLFDPPISPENLWMQQRSGGGRERSSKKEGSLNTIDVNEVLTFYGWAPAGRRLLT